MEAGMNALKTRQRSPQTTAQPRSAPSLREARDDDSATQSQAVALQTYLEAEFAESSGPPRLPLAVSLPLIAAASGGLWIAIIASVRAVLG
jgi:hypothetical protein